MNEVEEVWKDINGYEGFYQISNLGRVRGVDRIIPFIGRGGKPTTRLQRGKVLKTSVGTSGYETYHMYGEDQERVTIMLHRVVAKHFLDPEDGKDFVNHKDGNKLNNVFTNLEWVTKSENTLHAIDTGLLKKAGEDCNLSKLTEKQVLEIISLRKFGTRKYFAKDIAVRYGLSEGYVSELGSSKDKWTRLKESVSEEELYEIFLVVTKDFEKSEFNKTPSKHKLSNEEAFEIIERRRKGDRIVDIARDFDKPQKFISWYTRKYLNEQEK